MFRYTASKQILHTLRKIRREPYVRDKEYHFIRSCLPSGATYSMYTAFWRHYDGFVFYSRTELQEVPVNGFLFPVSLFDVEEVQ